MITREEERAAATSDVRARRMEWLARCSARDGMGRRMAEGFGLLAEAAREGGGRPSTADVDGESTVELKGGET